MADRDTTATPYKLSGDGVCYFAYPDGSLYPNLPRIRQEALLPNNLSYHPLPLYSNWGAGAERGTYQIDNYLRQGWYWLPVIALREYHAKDLYEDYQYKPLFSFCKQARLPITFQTTQIQAQSFSDSQFNTRPDSTNPCVLQVNGLYNGSPGFYLFTPWPPDPTVYDQIGEEFVTLDPALDWMQAQWNSPVKLVVINNNEASYRPHNEHHEVQGDPQRGDARFVALYGADWNTDTFADRDQVLTYQGAAISNIYGRMFTAFNNALLPGWASVVRHVGYQNGFGEAYGRWGGWINFETVTQSTLNPMMPAWNGGSPPIGYINWPGQEFHFQCWSPMMGLSNQSQCKALWYQEDPDWWDELSIWEGGPQKIYGQNGTEQSPDYADQDAYPYATIDTNNGRDLYGAKLMLTPEKFRSYARVAMWSNRPRVVRHYFWYSEATSWIDTWNVHEVIRQVWETPLLTQFWRSAELVVNTSQVHPYWDSLLPPGYPIDESKRWIYLICSTDPNWNAPDLFDRLLAIVPVYAIAMKTGTAPSREWLLITHPTIEDMTAVTITIPDYQNVTLDLTVGGQYWHIVEGQAPVEVTV